MPAPSLTSRERIRLTLEHQPTDRVPVAMVCSGINAPADRAFNTLLQRDRGVDLQTFLHRALDIREVSPRYIGPPLKEGEDMWGVRRKPISYGPSTYDEIIHYPLALIKTPGDLDNYRWPTTQWFDYSALDDHIRLAQQDGEHCLMVSNGNIFETVWYMRGFEQIFVDMLLNPEVVSLLMKRVADFYIDHFTHMLETAAGRVDLAFTADDIGGQNGLLMSLKTWEQLIKPHHVRLNKAIHEFGVKVIYHTDGAVMEAVPGLIDMGIDILQALQFSAKGMDARMLKKSYGHRICFEGGVSVQTTLPFGTPEDVYQETGYLIDVLGAGGGYILGPSHAIQAGTPPENILAMFDAALGPAFFRGGVHG